jgi:predicted nucleic acid-binding protein
VILLTADIWAAALSGKHPAVNTRMSDLLRRREVLGHEYVLGDLMLGSNYVVCRPVIEKYADLEQAEVLPLASVWAFAKAHDLSGKGLSWDDAALLASVHHRSAKIWTSDEHLSAVADALGVAYTEVP